jgi:hypothetical protein
VKDYAWADTSAGMRYRHANDPAIGNRIRVRGKRLDQVDTTKLTLAYWLLAKQLVEDKTDPRELNEEEVRKVAGGLTDEQVEDFREGTS